MPHNLKSIKEIKTKHFHAICNEHDIIINWNGKTNKIDKYEEPEKHVIDNRIYKYSSKELLYRYDKNLFYVNNKGINKIILENVSGCSIYNYKTCKKIVVVEDASDPPDNIFIFPVNELIDKMVNLNIKEDRLKYHVLSVSDWSNDMYSDNKYFYVFTDYELKKINIKTLKILVVDMDNIQKMMLALKHPKLMYMRKLDSSD